MLHLCRFVAGLRYRVRLDPAGSVALIGENGSDILFYAQFRADPPHLVLNTAIDRQWGAEVHLPLHQPLAPPLADTAHPPQSAPSQPTPPAPPVKPCEIVLHFSGTALQVDLDGQSHVFDRFTADHAKAVSFVRLNWASDVDAALIWRGETLEAALVSIEAHLLHRRIDDLHRRLEARDAP